MQTLLGLALIVIGIFTYKKIDILDDWTPLWIIIFVVCFFTSVALVISGLLPLLKQIQ